MSHSHLSFILILIAAAIMLVALVPKIVEGQEAVPITSLEEVEAIEWTTPIDEIGDSTDTSTHQQALSIYTWQRADVEADRAEAEATHRLAVALDTHLAALVARMTDIEQRLAEQTAATQELVGIVSQMPAAGGGGVSEADLEAIQNQIHGEVAAEVIALANERGMALTEALNERAAEQSAAIAVIESDVASVDGRLDDLAQAIATGAQAVADAVGPTTGPRSR